MATARKIDGKTERPVALARPTGKPIDPRAFALEMQRRFPKILKRLGE